MKENKSKGQYKSNSMKLTEQRKRSKKQRKAEQRRVQTKEAADVMGSAGRPPPPADSLALVDPLGHNAVAFGELREKCAR